MAGLHGLPQAPGFHFTYRDSFFDWRLLHGIDPDSMVRSTDVRSLEACLDTLQRGSLPSERALSARNCAQLFRLMQLALEYLAHLRASHASLLARYDDVAAAADGWRACAAAYLEVADGFLAECADARALSRPRLEGVDGARTELEAADAVYNAALDRLEADDVHARQFHFRRQRSELMWQQVHSVDLEEVLANIDVATLDQVLPNVTYGSIAAEDVDQLTPHHFSQLVPLAQCCLDYLLFQANATGTLLVRPFPSVAPKPRVPQKEVSMARLQAVAADIPTLTSATHAMHNAVTGVIIEAHAAGASAHGGTAHAASAALAAMRMSLPAAFAHHRGPHGGVHTGVGAATAPPGALAAHAEEARHSRGSSLLQAAEMQSRTAELHFRVDSLEGDLRMERHKTDEIRHILRDIHQRIAHSANQQAGGPAGRPPLSPPVPRKAAPDSALASGGGAHRGGAGGLLSPFENASRLAGAALMQSAEVPIATAHGTQTSVGTGGLGTSPTRVRITVDEAAIRGDERRRAMDLIHMQVEALKQLALSRRGGGGGGRGGRPMRSPRLRSTRQTDGSSGGRGSGGGGSVRQAASVEVSAPFARASAPASPLPYSATSLPLAAAGVARVARDEAAVQSEGSNSSRQSGQAPRRRATRAMHRPSTSSPALPSVGGAAPLEARPGDLPTWQPPSNAKEAAEFMRAAAAAAAAEVAGGKPPLAPRRITSPRRTHTRAASDLPAMPGVLTTNSVPL